MRPVTLVPSFERRGEKSLVFNPNEQTIQLLVAESTTRWQQRATFFCQLNIQKRSGTATSNTQQKEWKNGKEGTVVIACVINLSFCKASDFFGGTIRGTEEPFIVSPN